MKVSDAILMKPLVEKFAAQEMDAAVAMKFAAFAKDVLTASQEFEVKRAQLFEKYGEQVDSDGNWKIKEENEKKFQAAIKRALNKELEIEAFDMSNSGLKVSPADVVNVLSLLK